MSETVRHEPKLFAVSGPVTGHEGKYTVAHVGCSCGWNADGNSYKKEGDWHDHMAAAPPVPASGGQDGLRGEQMGAFDIWFDAYAKRTPKEHWSLRDAFETGKAFAESRILTATPSSAPASQPDAWIAARHWLLTDDTPNDLALEEGSRRIASLAKLLASRASQPEQAGRLTAEQVQRLRGVFKNVLEHNNVLEQVTLANWKEGDSPSMTVNFGGLTESLLELLDEAIVAALASPGSQPLRSAISAAWKDDAFQARVNEVVDAAQEGQPPEADLEYVRNLAATDISNEIPLTDAQFNWLQERLRKLVRAASRGESA